MRGIRGARSQTHFGKVSEHCFMIENVENLSRIIGWMTAEVWGMEALQSNSSSEKRSFPLTLVFLSHFETWVDLASPFCSGLLCYCAPCHAPSVAWPSGPPPGNAAFHPMPEFQWQCLSCSRPSSFRPFGLFIQKPNASLFFLPSRVRAFSEGNCFWKKWLR